MVPGDPRWSKVVPGGSGWCNNDDASGTPLNHLKRPSQTGQSVAYFGILFDRFKEKKNACNSRDIRPY